MRNVNNTLQPQVGRWHQARGRDVILESIISVVFAFDDAEWDFRVCKGQDVNVEERGVTLAITRFFFKASYNEGNIT